MTFQTLRRFALAALCGVALSGPAAAADNAPKWSLAVHGGAGVLERGELTPEKDKAFRAGLDAALEAGAKVLKAGGSSLDAVEAAVRVLEDNPLFNAGRGAVPKSAPLTIAWSMSTCTWPSESGCLLWRCRKMVDSEVFPVPFHP